MLSARRRPTASPTARPTSHPTARPTSKPTARPTSTPSIKPKHSSSHGHKNNTGAIVAGVLVPLFVLTAIALYMYRKHRQYIQRFVTIPLPELKDIFNPKTYQRRTTKTTAKHKTYIYGQVVHDEENNSDMVTNPLQQQHQVASRRHHESIDTDLLDEQDSSIEEKISSNGIVKSGFLHKQSTSGSWLKRWFFIKDGCLYYSKTNIHPSASSSNNSNNNKDVIAAVPVANFMISTIKVVNSREFHVISPGKRGVGTGGGSYAIMTETESEQAEWVQIIQAQIARSLSNTLSITSSQKVKELSSTEFFVPNAAALTKLHEANPYCVDCGGLAPEWASLNLAAMMCIDCSGTHRSLGSHITKVRSLKLDKWNKNLLQLLVLIGNEHVNEIWEGKLIQEEGNSQNNVNKKKVRPQGIDRERYIQLKYRDKAYLLHTEEDNNPEIITFKYLKAAWQGNFLEVQRQIALGVDINCRSKTTTIDPLMMPAGYTALMLAVSMGHILCVELLMQWNVDVKMRNIDGLAALDLAKGQSSEQDLVTILTR